MNPSVKAMMETEKEASAAIPRGVGGNLQGECLPSRMRRYFIRENVILMSRCLNRLEAGELDPEELLDGFYILFHVGADPHHFDAGTMTDNDRRWRAAKTEGSAACSADWTA